VARNYEQVWEEMLQVALGHEERRRDRFSGTYHLQGAKPKSGLLLKPDVLVRTRLGGRPVRLVLDAKDYRKGALPNTPDLTKQILYRLMLSDRIYEGATPLEAIGNAFLFPAVNQGLVRCRGTHALVGAPQSGAPGVISCLELDLQRAEAAYLAGRVDEELLAQVAEAVLLDTPVPSNRRPGRLASAHPKRPRVQVPGELPGPEGASPARDPRL